MSPFLVGREGHTETMTERFSREAFRALTEGFWATRVSNGLTTPEEAEKRVRQQHDLIDSWLPAVPDTGKHT